MAGLLKLPPTSPSSSSSCSSSSSPLLPVGGATVAARRLFDDLSSQELAEEAGVTAVQKSPGGSYKTGDARGMDGWGTRSGPDGRWTELDAEAERRYLADPMQGYTRQFDKEGEARDLDEINGAWLDARLRSVAARAKLAESRMIRRLRTQLSA